jgi:hypothetical protein
MRPKKILIDASMIVILVLLFPTARADPILHIILGFAIIPIIALHLLFNGEWLIGSIKNLIYGKLGEKAWYMLKLIIGLMITFSICIMSGIFIYLYDYSQFGYLFTELSQDTLRLVYRIHGLSGVACLALTVFHVKVHLGYLKSFFIQRRRTNHA